LQIRLLKLLISTKEKKDLQGYYEKLFKLCKVLPLDLKLKMAIIIEQNDKTEFKKGREHAYATRQSKKPTFAVPKIKNYYGKRERRWLTPTLLNELPLELLKNINSKNHLKHTLRKHYLSLCP
jgi:hypothetical protein